MDRKINIKGVTFDSVDFYIIKNSNSLVDALKLLVDGIQVTEIKQVYSATGEDLSPQTSQPRKGRYLSWQAVGDLEAISKIEEHVHREGGIVLPLQPNYQNRPTYVQIEEPDGKYVTVAKYDYNGKKWIDLGYRIAA